MSGLEPFSPDDEYCVYCHAPADGMCADCGALCCADCVELVMGWTKQRAVCTSCADSETDHDGMSQAPAWLAAMVALAAAVIYLMAL